MCTLQMEEHNIDINIAINLWELFRYISGRKLLFRTQHTVLSNGESKTGEARQVFAHVWVCAPEVTSSTETNYALTAHQVPTVDIMDFLPSISSDWTGKFIQHVIPLQSSVKIERETKCVRTDKNEYRSGIGNISDSSRQHSSKDSVNA